MAGQDRVATAWLAGVLWLYMALGETRLLSQPRMAMVAWAALFGLPPAYVRFRALAHAVADEATAALAALLAAGAHALGRDLSAEVWAEVRVCPSKRISDFADEATAALAALLTAGAWFLMVVCHARLDGWCHQLYAPCRR